MKQRNRFKRYQKTVKIAAAIVWMAAAGFLYSCNSGKNNAILLSESEEAEHGLKTETEALAADQASEKLQRQAETPAEENNYCYVHICGEVESPGVYRMEEGSRVYQAVESAGGYTSQAAIGYLNLAQPVTDGMKLVVPGVDELERDELYGLASSAGDTKAGEMKEPQAFAKVNINTATKEQLMVLKGIGESRAEDIIRYREEHGVFEKVEDIMKVSGIKEAAFLKIKDDITV